jgi:hypothetical protein
MNILAKTINLSALGDGPPLIYPVSTSIVLPPGSKVMEYRTDGHERLPWFGFVDTDGDRALSVRLTTPAIRLAIREQGSGLKPDVISISLFTELWNDPTLIFGQFVVAFMFTVLHGVSSILSVVARAEAANDRLGTDGRKSLRRHAN